MMDCSVQALEEQRGQQQRNGDYYGIGIQNRIFQHLSRAFSPGDVNKCLLCLNELLVNFREESSGIGRFCRLEVPTDGQLAQFRFFLSKLVELHETGRPFRTLSQFHFFLSNVGQLAYRWNSSLRNPPIPLNSSRKLTNSSLREQGTFFNDSGRKSLPKC